DGIFPEVGTGVSFIRDALGRIDDLVLPDGSDLQYDYDAAGDLTRMVDGDGNVLVFAYDGAHRLVDYHVDGHPPIRVVTYGSDGRLESTVDDGGVVVSSVSHLDRFEQVTTGPDPRLTTTSQFDSDGQLRSTTQDYVDESGANQRLSTTMTYDADFRMATRT